MVAFGDLISDLSFVAHFTYCCEDNVVEDHKNGTCDCSDFSQRWNETCANVLFVNMKGVWCIDNFSNSKPERRRKRFTLDVFIIGKVVTFDV